MTFAFLDIGFPELCVVAFVGLALYGGRLPEMMRTLGAAYQKLRMSVESLTREATDVQRQLPQIYTPQPPKDPAALPRPAPTAAASSPTPPPSSTAGTSPAPAIPPPHQPGVMPPEPEEPPPV